MRSGLDLRWLATIAAVGLALAGCGSSGDSMGMDGEGDELGSGEQLTYENFGDAFIRNWCRGCHSSALEGAARSGAPDDTDLNMHEDVQAWADRILARATGDSPTMPPAGGPTVEELGLLQEWLDAGAP